VVAVEALDLARLDERDREVPVADARSVERGPRGRLIARLVGLDLDGQGALREACAS
jgi:hypothetical protein